MTLVTTKIAPGRSVTTMNYGPQPRSSQSSSKPAPTRSGGGGYGYIPNPQFQKDQAAYQQKQANEKAAYQKALAEKSEAVKTRVLSGGIATKPGVARPTQSPSAGTPYNPGSNPPSSGGNQGSQNQSPTGSNPPSSGGNQGSQGQAPPGSTQPGGWQLQGWPDYPQAPQPPFQVGSSYQQPNFNFYPDPVNQSLNSSMNLFSPQQGFGQSPFAGYGSYPPSFGGGNYGGGSSGWGGQPSSPSKSDLLPSQYGWGQQYGGYGGGYQPSRPWLGQGSVPDGAMASSGPRGGGQQGGSPPRPGLTEDGQWIASDGTRLGNQAAGQQYDQYLQGDQSIPWSIYSRLPQSLRGSNPNTWTDDQWGEYRNSRRGVPEDLGGLYRGPDGGVYLSGGMPVIGRDNSPQRIPGPDVGSPYGSGGYQSSFNQQVQSPFGNNQTDMWNNMGGFVQAVNNQSLQKPVGTYLGEGNPGPDYAKQNYDIRSLINQGNQMVQNGWQNPFAQQFGGGDFGGGYGGGYGGQSGGGQQYGGLGLPAGYSDDAFKQAHPGSGGLAPRPRRSDGFGGESQGYDPSQPYWATGKKGPDGGVTYTNRRPPPGAMY